MIQPDFFLEPIEENRESKLIMDIWHCIVFAHPLPGMWIQEMGPDQIRKGLSVLDTYFSETEKEINERLQKIEALLESVGL